ncbi:hypothetical protein TWF481_008638 [Arthrobotrys musiformis]|uniref:Biogenesis of lysosome-related organelles complex 1 subunit CNL1 n=1 Tax=Arthrobotrys musiformis TaxID=47236 RepID=A0AAV9W996_9PEZI
MASHDERRQSSRNSISSSDAELIRDHSRRLGLASPSPSSASSQLLDPSTVGALSSHFDQLLGAIAGRIESLSEQTRVSTQQSHRQHLSAVDKATAEIERFKEILHQIDELELEFDRIRRIQEIVSSFKSRVATLERRFGR